MLRLAMPAIAVASILLAATPLRPNRRRPPIPTVPYEHPATTGELDAIVNGCSTVDTNGEARRRDRRGDRQPGRLLERLRDRLGNRRDRDRDRPFLNRLRHRLQQRRQERSLAH